MQVKRIEVNYIPKEHKDFADEYEERLKGQGAFLTRYEDEEHIVINAKYTFDIKEAEDADCD